MMPISVDYPDRFGSGNGHNQRFTGDQHMFEVVLGNQCDHMAPHGYEWATIGSSARKMHSRTGCKDSEPDRAAIKIYGLRVVPQFIPVPNGNAE